MTRARRLLDTLVFAPLDPASLAAFRILFGVVMAASTVRFIALGWVEEFYVQPAFHFTWEAFRWVRPLPPDLMHFFFAILTALAIGIALGLHSRLCSGLFFLAFSYVELIDKTTYLNHYYLVSLLSGILTILPAHRLWSIDGWRRPAPEPAAVPAWTVNLLRFQIAVVYLFAGLAKINRDWLVDAQPLGMWLAARSDVPVVGNLFTLSWMPYAFSWFGAAYDLTIVFFLLSRRARLPAYLTVVAFHLMTGVLFPIGMFPWIMIAATPVFFLPDWPRRLWPRAIAVEPPSAVPAQQRRSLAIVACLAAYAVVQIGVPLRSYWPGADPEWTGRGFNFAWRVMLAEKAGYTEFRVYDPTTGQRWLIRPRDFITERQERMMSQDPFMVRDLARHIANGFRARGIGAVEIRADSFAALNGRPAQRLIDPWIDLATASSSDWILPLRRDAAMSGDNPD